MAGRILSFSASGLRLAILPWPAAYPVVWVLAATPCRHVPLMKKISPKGTGLSGFMS
jgi:hypothetical protein